MPASWRVSRTGRNVPESDSGYVIGRGQEPAVGAERHVADDPVHHPRASPEHRSGFQVEDDEQSVGIRCIGRGFSIFRAGGALTCRGQEPAVRAEGDAVKPAGFFIVAETGFPVRTFHASTRPLGDAAATTWPSGADGDPVDRPLMLGSFASSIASSRISLAVSTMVRRGCTRPAGIVEISRHQQPVTIREESDARIGPTAPRQVVTSGLDAGSQILTVWSELLEASRRPSGLNVRQVTFCLWPRRCRVRGRSQFPRS